MFERFVRSGNAIRFHDDKSMSVARDTMLRVDPGAVLPGAKANPYSRIKKEQDDQNGMLETKI